MTVTTTTNRNDYTANGVLTTFAYAFRIFEDTDLEVYVDGDIQTPTTHYTVTGAGDANGGDVEFVSPPADQATVTIIRVLPAVQESAYPANDRFPSTVHENLADRAVMLIQQLQEVDLRALKMSIASLYADLTVPDPEAGKYLRWLTDLSGLENADIVDSGSLGIPVAVTDGGTGLTATGDDGEVLTAASGALAYAPTGRLQLTNESGSQVAAGTVVVPDTAAQSFDVTTSAAATSPIWVVDETIDDQVAGAVRQRGLVTVLVQGNVAIGDYIGTSTTSGRAGSLGASPVSGAFGYAVTAYSGGAAGTVVAVLFGVTIPTLGSKPSFLLTPESAMFPTTNFPALVNNQGSNQVAFTLDYDTTTGETAVWRLAIPTGVTFTGATIVITSRQASATTGTVGWIVTSLTRADGEAWDTAGATDTVTAATVKGTLGQLQKQSKALTVTGWAAGETLYLKITRDVGNDTAAGDSKLVEAVLSLT